MLVGGPGLALSSARGFAVYGSAPSWPALSSVGPRADIVPVMMLSLVYAWQAGTAVSRQFQARISVEGRT